jgi:hypothetical protein
VIVEECHSGKVLIGYVIMDLDDKVRCFEGARSACDSDIHMIMKFIKGGYER